MKASIFQRFNFFHKYNDKPEKCKYTFFLNKIAYFLLISISRVLTKIANVNIYERKIGQWKTRWKASELFKTEKINYIHSVTNSLSSRQVKNT